MNQKDLANTMTVQKVTANFDYTKATLQDKYKRRGIDHHDLLQYLTFYTFYMIFKYKNPPPHPFLVGIIFISNYQTVIFHFLYPLVIRFFI
ncbi:hypothetical protein VNO80_16509 [Phaseolus coccineus]|uniref:Uncharacterized protein n=1 Tax=Phaseolus coccineus TaxID=3886 RepID=A0AAN9MLV9_PHACN